MPSITEEQTKQIEAWIRAMPITRMMDYGMKRDPAQLAHDLVREGGAWDLVLENMAQEQEASARAEKDARLARDAWHAASATFNFAQMAYNSDGERKRLLYRQSTRCFANFAAGADVRISRIELPYRQGKLFGWHCHATNEKKIGAVILFGGMSGWATSYRSMAEALCGRGIDCLLVDGPGQGESRLEGGIYADADLTSGFSCFVDYALKQGFSKNIGLWGNSFGGLLAALTAHRDSRIEACCINGGPLVTGVPTFRTAREQLAAMFGQRDPDALAEIVPSLAFDNQRAALNCAVLVLDGGADVLVPPGSQRVFLEGNHHPLSRMHTWPDGEHTIYNHAAERNALVANWFVSAFTVA